MKGYKIRGKTLEKIFRGKRLFRQSRYKSIEEADRGQVTTYQMLSIVWIGNKLVMTSTQYHPPSALFA